MRVGNLYSVALALLMCAPCLAEDDEERPPKFSLTTGMSCRMLLQMLRSKRSLSKRLELAVNNTLTRPSAMTAAEKKVQAEIIDLFRKELDQFESGIFKSLNGLDRALAAQYWSLPSIKSNIKNRLEGLKAASLHEQESFDAIVELAKKQEAAEMEHAKDLQRNLSHKQDHDSHRSAAEKLIQSLVNGVVNDVVAAADKLEDNMKNEQEFKDVKQKSGAKLETVIKLEEGVGGVVAPQANAGKKTNHSGSASKKKQDSDAEQEREKRRQANDDGVGQMSVLIDSKGNKYILAEPAKKMLTHHDWHLLSTLSMAVAVCFVLGMMCQYIGIPALFGYVLAGVIIGPSGMQLVQSHVQVETLGEIGAYLLLFGVGLDFSTTQFKEVWRVAVCGGGVTTAVMQLASLLAGVALHILPQQSCFVAACLTLSSTQLAVRVLAQYNVRRPHVGTLSPQKASSVSIKTRKERLLDSSDGLADLGDIGNGLFGILLMQDIFLALFVTLLPTMAQEIQMSYDSTKLKETKKALDGTLAAAALQRNAAGPEVTNAITSESHVVLGILAVSVKALFLLAICYALAVLVFPAVFRVLVWPGDHYDIRATITLGSLSLLAACIMLTSYIGLSAELGCLLAGVLIGSQGQPFTQHVLTCIEPVKQLFSAVFFVTIGFHVFPVFILNELGVVMTLTTAVVLVKFSVTYLVISCMSSTPHRWMIGLASSSVAQVSECAFLVGSQGRRLGLISREVYLLLLSITTTSQLVAPFLWYMMWKGKSPVSRSLKFISGLIGKLLIRVRVRR